VLPKNGSGSVENDPTRGRVYNRSNGLHGFRRAGRVRDPEATSEEVDDLFLSTAARISSPNGGKTVAPPTEWPKGRLPDEGGGSAKSRRTVSALGDSADRVGRSIFLNESKNHHRVDVKRTHQQIFRPTLEIPVAVSDARYHSTL
jgi:hypothetical protein